MTPTPFPESSRYTDLEIIYAECSGPGGLQLTEFMADKMGLHPGARLLDIGIERGYQTYFLAKEYRVQVIGRKLLLWGGISPVCPYNVSIAQFDQSKGEQP